MAYVKPTFITPEKMAYLASIGRRVPRSPTLDEIPQSSPPKSIRTEIMEKNALLLLQPDPEFYPGMIFRLMNSRLLVFLGSH